MQLEVPSLRWAASKGMVREHPKRAPRSIGFFSRDVRHLSRCYRVKFPNMFRARPSRRWSAQACGLLDPILLVNMIYVRRTPSDVRIIPLTIFQEVARQRRCRKIEPAAERGLNVAECGDSVAHQVFSRCCQSETVDGCHYVSLATRSSRRFARFYGSARLVSWEATA
jgi:hypothetical protein